VNWGRGLFRLWVIFSALWIAVLSAIFIKDGHLLEANKTYDIEGRFKEKYEVVAPPLLRRFSAPLRRSVIDFGSTDMVPHIAARKTHQWL
jgi:hypothetical protein